MSWMCSQAGKIKQEDQDHTHSYTVREEYVDVKLFNLLGLSSPIFSADKFVDGLDFAGEFLLLWDIGITGSETSR